MKFELLEQSAQYTFINEKYENGKKTRLFNNLKPTASAQALQDFGSGIVKLQDGDALGEVVLIQRQVLSDAE